MNAADTLRTLVAVRAIEPGVLSLKWSDGTRARVDLGRTLQQRAFRALRDENAFARVRIGEWGHSIEWPSGIGLSADTLWLETLSATGHGDTRAFLEWRMRHGLSLTKAADALGVSRRMAAYYSNGEKRVPRPILLACKGWEAEQAA
ncbi:MAG TPA: DUF2442 domain-containing protein [Rhizomicrobium sp.]|jgi:hypothetical protein|nr:DUF2442 domain-containing protein [Rhizomicrobium sp.]